MSDDIEVAVFPSEDPRLDWISMHDPRSLNYPIRATVGSVEDRPKRWAPGRVLDQGREGACVGFGWTGELMASPRPDPHATKVEGDAYARNVYREAQRIDEWPGENYEGTSVLAGAKVVANRGLIGEYRWAFSIEDIRDAIITTGPVVIGIPWYSRMYATDAAGMVNVGGDLVGGHCLYLYEYHPGKRIKGLDWHSRHRVFRWRNSWSASYGINGDGYVRYEDLRDLLKEWGEACVPIQRNLVRI